MVSVYIQYNIFFLLKAKDALQHRMYGSASIHFLLVYDPSL